MSVAEEQAEEVEILEQSEIDAEIESDDDSPLDLPESAFTPINFASASRRIIDLYRSYNEDKELDPRPSFQRGYVWDRQRATRLIESILLHVPIPLIYTAEEDDGTEVVIDGQQRLTTCFSFIEGFFPPSKSDLERSKRGESVKRRPFKLGKMKILSHLQGKSYAELPADLKTLFNRYNLQVIKISKDSHEDVKFEIFERLNTGSVSLSDQEIRNCIYRGPYNDLICHLANHPSFRRALGISSEAARMQDVELVLRFMAFNEVTHLNFNGKMRGFLNAHMRDRRFISDEAAERYKSDFLQACDLSFSVFGDRAFRRYSEGSAQNPNGKWERAVNKAIFDAIMFWFARYDKRQVTPKKDQIRERFIDMCVNDRAFIDSVTLGTADPTRVRTRFKAWEEALEDIITAPKSERRIYSFEEKEGMYDRDRKCALCQQQIEHLDDAEVDHRVAFSNGGATDAGNAQLTHRYCNRSKGAK